MTMKKIYSEPKIQIVNLMAEGLVAQSGRMVEYTDDAKASHDADVLSNRRGIWDED